MCVCMKVYIYLAICLACAIYTESTVPRFVLLASFGVRIPKGNWTKSGKITAAELTSATLVLFFCSTIAFVAHFWNQKRLSSGLFVLVTVPLCVEAVEADAAAGASSVAYCTLRIKSTIPQFRFMPGRATHFFVTASKPSPLQFYFLFVILGERKRERAKELGWHSIFHSRMLTFVLFTQCIFRLSLPQLFAYVPNTGCISGSTHHSSHPHHRQLQLRSNSTQHHCHYVICGVS